MIKVREIKIDAKDNGKELLKRKVIKKLNVKEDEILDFKITKESIDARKIPVYLIYEVDVKLKDENKIRKSKDILKVEEKKYSFNEEGSKELTSRIVVVGSGPAGLFASYMLSEAGYKPIIIERGVKVEERVEKVKKYWEEGILDENSNVCFGEGGAGTFSDGKLNTLNKDEFGRIEKVYEIFVENGAPEEILYKNKPHIGTDILRKVIKNMREKIISKGGEYRFSSMLTDLDIENDKLKGVYINGEYLKCENLVLAIGHSARDTFRMLHERGLCLENKPFAVGLRIIHNQELINDNQYGDYSKYFDNASYKLTYKSSSGKGVYTFCMCPGGYVVNSSNKNGELLVNGMSNYKRDSGYANSAVVVTIDEKDYGTKLFDGMNYQAELEKKAYQIGCGQIPVERYEDYKNNIEGTSFGKIIPEFKGLYKFANLNEIFAEKINDTLKEGIENFNTKIKGFSDGDSVLAGVESRTSSPVRIIRDENMESNIKGIYPIGEGAGYSGGITTSSVDGIKVSEILRSKYKKIKK